MQRGLKELVAAALCLTAIVAGGVVAAPHADAAARQPQYVTCSRYYGPITHYSSTTYRLSNGDTARPQIAVWYDSVDRTLVCEEQAGVLWTTSKCSSRTIDVYFTNGVGGHKTSTLQCGTITYYSSYTSSDACSFSMSALTSDNYQVNWSSGGFC